MIAFVDDKIVIGKRHEGKIPGVCNLISVVVVVDCGYIGMFTL